MRRVEAVAAALERALPGAVERDASSADLTTYRVGGPLALLVRIRTEAEAVALAPVVGEHDVPVLVVGRGSNLLVADEGFGGLAVLLEGAFDVVDVDAAAAEVHAGASVSLPVLARRAAAAGVAGLEFLVGIPGSVGGAVRMNAGGHGRETVEVLDSARVLDLGSGAVAERSVGELGLGYRRSALGPRDVVLDARFQGSAGDPAACESHIAEIVRWRRAHQPGGANAGSVFANPPDDSAGRIVDACGLKGLRVGGAVVSAKHANFVQAEAGATAADVHALVQQVRRRVADDTGIDLRPEIRFVGFDEAVADR